MFLVDVNNLFLWQFKNAHWSKNNLTVGKFSADWNNGKILQEILTMLWQFCVFLTDSKIWQTLNYYLNSTQTNRSAMVLFVESSMLHICIQNTWKYAMQTCFNESRLRKQICIKLTFIPFKEVLKSTELLLRVRSPSANIWFWLAKIFAVRLS